MVEKNPKTPTTPTPPKTKPNKQPPRTPHPEVKELLREEFPQDSGGAGSWAAPRSGAVGRAPQRWRRAARADVPSWELRSLARVRGREAEARCCGAFAFRYFHEPSPRGVLSKPGLRCRLLSACCGTLWELTQAPTHPPSHAGPGACAPAGAAAQAPLTGSGGHPDFKTLFE